MITDNVKYYLQPSMVFNKVKRMYKKFISEYINKDYIHEFQQPTTFVSYYNLNELKHNINQQQSHSRERVDGCKKSKNKRSDYPMFIFKDILGYDGRDEQLIQLTANASRR